MPYERQIAETVTLRGHQGDQIDAYLARPLGAGPHPGVVVIHHMPGWDGPSTYENAGHAFFAVDRPQFRQHAALDGWQKVFAWFGKYLR